MNNSSGRQVESCHLSVYDEGHILRERLRRATYHERRLMQHVTRDLWLAKGIPGQGDLLISSEDRMSIVGKDVRFKNPARS